jgi:bifunctional DNA-binding transcriptional regulator/antitoxin component of YhaV-PrlF toxin-antitoxin module
MSKVTSKYRVTVPRRIAEEFHIRPGDRSGAPRPTDRGWKRKIYTAVAALGEIIVLV